METKESHALRSMTVSKWYCVSKTQIQDVAANKVRFYPDRSNHFLNVTVTANRATINALKVSLGVPTQACQRSFRDGHCTRLCRLPTKITWSFISWITCLSRLLPTRFIDICEKKFLCRVCLGKQLAICSGDVMAMYINLYYTQYTSIYIKYMYIVCVCVCESKTCDVFVTLQGSLPYIGFFLTNAWAYLITH